MKCASCGSALDRRAVVITRAGDAWEVKAVVLPPDEGLNYLCVTREPGKESCVGRRLRQVRGNQ